MSETAELVDKVLEKTAKLHEAVDAQLADVKGAQTNHEEAIEKINKDLGDLVNLKREAAKDKQLVDELKEKMEEWEAARNSPKWSAERKGQDVKDAHARAFVKWMRNRGQDHEDKNELKACEEKYWNFLGDQSGIKQVNIGTPSAGGYAVPEVIGTMIESFERRQSDVLNAAYGIKSIQVSTSDYKELVDLLGASGGWVGEAGPRPGTSTPVLRERTPTHGEMYGYPESSEWALDDMFFDVGSWLAESVADIFVTLRGDAVIRGDGINKPTGMLNTTPTTDPDEEDGSPARAEEAYQYVPSNTVEAIDFDDLIDVRVALNRRYRANAAWAMNSVTEGEIRKIKDSTGQYIWSPSTVPGDPDFILGFPIMIWEQLDDVASSGSGLTFPVAFGNFRRAYLHWRRTPLRVTVDQVTNIGFIKWYIRQREGGTVLNNDAVKFVGTAEGP